VRTVTSPISSPFRSRRTCRRAAAGRPPSP
jgi:hypothetical protein